MAEAVKASKFVASKDVPVLKPGKAYVDKGHKLPSSGVRKRTEEGYIVYKEEELNFGKGGDTDLCPFDCDCCF